MLRSLLVLGDIEQSHTVEGVPPALKMHDGDGHGQKHVVHRCRTYTYL